MNYFYDRKRLIMDITDNIEKCYYYLCETDLLITAKIVDVKYNKKEVEIIFEGGQLSIWEDNKIKKVKRPTNIIKKFDWCYLIKNNEDEFIGYIGKNNS